MIVINKDNKEYSNHMYTIELLHGDKYSIYADHSQEALDILIDHIEEHKEELKGYLLSQEDLKEHTEEELEEYVSGGNHGAYLSFQYHEIRVEESDIES